MLKAFVGTIIAIGIVFAPLTVQAQRPGYQDLSRTCRGEILRYGTVCKTLFEGYPSWYVINNNGRLISITPLDQDVRFAVTWTDRRPYTFSMIVSPETGEVLNSTSPGTEYLMSFYQDDFQYIVDAMQSGI